MGSLCHHPGTQLFLLRPADAPRAGGGRPSVHRGVVWLLGTLGATSTLHGLRSTRETGACTESARHRKEAWQWLAIQSSRDSGLRGAVDHWTRRLLHSWLRKTLVWALVSSSDLQFLVCIAGGLECHLWLQCCPCRLSFQTTEQSAFGLAYLPFRGHVIIWSHVLNFFNSNCSSSGHWLVSSSGNTFEHLLQKWVRS